jgi:transcriptional regulator of acetoin/glycerol metabolism
MEKSHILFVLEENNWNITKTALDLDIDRTTLYNKIKKYQLDRLRKGNSD